MTADIETIKSSTNDEGNAAHSLSNKNSGLSYLAELLAELLAALIALAIVIGIVWLIGSYYLYESPPQPYQYPSYISDQEVSKLTYAQLSQSVNGTETLIQKIKSVGVEKIEFGMKPKYPELGRFGIDNADLQDCKSSWKSAADNYCYYLELSITTEDMLKVIGPADSYIQNMEFERREKIESLLYDMQIRSLTFDRDGNVHAVFDKTLTSTNTKAEISSQISAAIRILFVESTLTSVIKHQRQLKQDWGTAPAS